MRSTRTSPERATWSRGTRMTSSTTRSSASCGSCDRDRLRWHPSVDRSVGRLSEGRSSAEAASQRVDLRPLRFGHCPRLLVAAAFCRTCSGDVAPAITVATDGVCASQESASPPEDCARAPRRSRRAVPRRRTVRRWRSAPRADPKPRKREFGVLLPCRYFPVSMPPARGKNGVKATPSCWHIGRMSCSAARLSRL